MDITIFDEKWILEFIEYGYVYSLICNMMMWRIEIEGKKLEFYTTSL